MDRHQWNDLAARFESTVYDIAAIDAKGVLADLVSRACPHPRRRVLVDLGCRIGTFVKEFGGRFESVVGVDFSSAMLERARERCSDLANVRWVCGDIPRAAASLGAAADLTVCLNVITSPSAAKREALWDAVATVTKPGGRVLVNVPALESAEMIAAVESPGAEIATDDIVDAAGDSQKYYTKDEVARAASTHGLRVEEIARVFYPWTEELPKAPRGAHESPWDWACLARRTSPDG
ncbi:MAG TPA: class I SAM-dependent methyltransferase [Gaiellaceae bacterium]|nr:class I SAM-dependent methyltransferase [Gaiellaceae bacterium]